MRRGLPHAIDDYRASTDVFTRAAPFLSLVFLPIARMDLKIRRWEGALLFIVYVVLMTMLFLNGAMG